MWLFLGGAAKFICHFSFFVSSVNSSDIYTAFIFRLSFSSSCHIKYSSLPDTVLDFRLPLQKSVLTAHVHANAVLQSFLLMDSSVNISVTKVMKDRLQSKNRADRCSRSIPLNLSVVKSRCQSNAWMHVHTPTFWHAQFYLSRVMRSGLMDVPVDSSAMWHQPTFPSLSPHLRIYSEPQLYVYFGIFWLWPRCANCAEACWVGEQWRDGGGGLICQLVVCNQAAQKRRNALLMKPGLLPAEVLTNRCEMGVNRWVLNSSPRVWLQPLPSCLCC